MRRIGFDYPNTCPKIDAEIAKAERTIRNFLETLLEEACPLLPCGVLQRLATENAQDLYRDLEDIFEVTRKANEDMRAEAENQITDLQDKLADLEAEVERLERETT